MEFFCKWIEYNKGPREYEKSKALLNALKFVVLFLSLFNSYPLALNR